MAGEPKPGTGGVYREQPFVSPLAWALFSAYSAIVVSSFMVAKAFEQGVADPLKFINKERIKTVLVAIAPEYEKLAGEWDVTLYYHFLDDIESRLLAELRNILEGREQAQFDLERSAKIIKAVNSANAAQAEATIQSDE
jgi:hypothetical protein